jgi:hypothetical protein
MRRWSLILGAFFLLTAGEGTANSSRAQASPGLVEVVLEPQSSGAREGEGIAGNSVSARITALIAKGQLAEAEVLIAEGTASGLLTKSQATQLLNEIARLNTRLGDIPARLQRVRDFPSQLKDHTLQQIEQMLFSKDFSIATQEQLKMAQKLIRQQPRLMEKY